MYGNYGREDQYGGRSEYDYPSQQPNRGYSQPQQYDGQQSWGGNQPNSDRPGGPPAPANMASQWDGGPPNQGDMMQRNYQQLGQSRQSSYNAPHDNNHPNALPDDKAARAYEFLAKVDEDQKRKDELEEQKREVQRLRDEVKKSMETLQHLQGGVGRDGGMGGGWPQEEQQPPPELQQHQLNKGPVKSILKRPKALGAQEDDQPRINYCDVCSIQFNTTREYQQHCAGLLHTKQLMQQKMGISMDKDKADEPGLMQGRQGQSWMGGNQRGPMANPPVNLNAIYSAFEDYEEDVGKATQMSQNKPQYVDGGNVHCKICGSTFYTNEEMRTHAATEEHCRKYLSLHNSLGTEKFLAKYGEHIFGMAVKYVAAMVDRHIRTDLSGRDLKYYKEFMTRSGVVNGYQCRICQASTFMMEHWIAHCAGKKHTRTCMTKMLSMSSDAYLQEFGDVPGPAPSKTIDSRLIQKWESVFILEALKSVPKMSLIQEQQVADSLQQARQQPGPGPPLQPYANPPPGMSPPVLSPQGMNHMDRNQMDRNQMDRNQMDRNQMDRNPMDRNPMDRNQMDRNQMDRNQPGAPYQQGRNQPGGNPTAITQKTPPPKGLLGDGPGILEQLQARYEQQKKAQTMTEVKASPSAQAYDQQDRGGYGQSRDFEDLRDQRGPHPLPGRQPGPPPMDTSYNRPPHHDDGFAMEPRHVDEHHAAPYENPFNQPQGPPHRNAPDMYGQMPPPRPHPSDRFERDRNMPGLQPGQRSPYDQGREPRHENQGREPRYDNQGREPRQENQGREPRHDNQGREPRHDNQGRESRHDNQGREPRHENQGRDREYGRDDRRSSSHDHASRDRPSHDRSSNDRSSNDRSSNDRSSRDHKEKPSQSSNMYDPFESESPAAAGPAAAGGNKGVVPTAKALQMLHQIQEKQRVEQEKLEKQLKDQQKMLDKQKKEMERERQKHQQELEKREKVLKEKQQKLEEEKREEERKRKEKERELEKERNLRLEEKRRQLQMKDDLERKRLQRQREELERKRQEKVRDEEDRKKKDEQEKRDEILKQQKLKEELQKKVQEEMESKRQDKLKREIEERVKQAELQKLKDKEMELERLVNAKKMELQHNNSGRQGQKQGRGRGGWRPVNAPGQFTPAAMPAGRNPIPSHLIAVPRSMVGTHMGMRPAYPVSMAGTLMPPGVPTTSVPQQGLIHGAPWHVPPPTAPQANQAPWNKAPPAHDPKTPQQIPKPTPATGAPPPWSAAKAGTQAEAGTGKKAQGKADTKSSDTKSDMPWKRKEEKAKEAADVPWKRKDDRSQDSSRDMPWKRKDKESSRDRSSHRDEKRESRGSSRERDSTRSRDAPWDRSRDRSRDQRTTEEDRGRSGASRRTPPNLRNEAPWHSKKGPEEKTAPWEASTRRSEGEGMTQDAPWAARRGGPGGRPNVEKGHTYKLVLTERDQHSWKDAQNDFIQCMDSGENTARPLKVFTNTLQSHMRRIQEAKDQLPEQEILATLSTEEQVVTKQIQQMTGLEPISVVTCTLHLLQAMDPRVFNILGTMDPNFMQSLISDAMAGGNTDDRGDRRRSRSRSPSRRDRDTRDSRDAPPWLRGIKRPTEQPDSDKRSRWQ